MPARAQASDGEVAITLRDRVPPIRGRVVDASGTGVPKAVVVLADPPTLDEISTLAGCATCPGSEVGPGCLGSRQFVADDGGRFEIDEVLPRDFSVRAHDPRSLAISVLRGVHPGSEIELRIGERPLVEVRGRVVDPRGRPIADACVFLLRDGASRQPIESEVRWTDAEGRFAWSGVDGEGLELAVQVQSYAEAKRHAFRTSDSGEQTLVAARAACARVQVATAGLGADAFRILDASEEPLWLGIGAGARDDFHAGASDELDLDGDAETESFWVSEDARWLVLLREGVEVARTRIRVVPGVVTLLRP